MKDTIVIATLAAVCVCESGCNQDNPGQSPYETGNSVTTSGGGTGSGGVTGSSSGGATSSTSGGVTGSSTGASGGMGATGTTSSTGTGATMGTGGTTTTSGSGGSMSTGAAGGGGMSSGAGGAAPDGPCDLTGRWLETTHYVTVALGANQTAHSYSYYEIGKKGDGFVVTKGLYCGDFAHGTGLVDVQVHFEPSNAAVMKRVVVTGRTATSVMSSGGCDVHFAKWYTVRGATVPYYVEDPSRPMPTVNQQASADGSTPGWEDWDGDGNPGLTGTISSTAVNGKIFTAPRRWDDPHGTVTDVKSTFKLSLAGWGQEQNVMQTDPPNNIILGMSATVANDPMLHFVGFARLAADQATGDDATICSQIMKLAPTLTPDAAAI